MASISTKVHQAGNYIVKSEFWNSSLLPLIKGKWKGIIQRRMDIGVQKIPVKYRKIIGIGSGVLVALSPIIFRFVKKKNWVLYVVFGVVEIFAASFFQDEKYGSRVIPVQQ
jgi:hypothetical protein